MSACAIFAATCTFAWNNIATPFTQAAKQGQILKIPIAHNDGNYTCDPQTLAELQKNGQIVFRYTTADGSG